MSILTTLCIIPYNVFVIWDTKYNWMMEWQGEDIIKYFWCDATEVDYKHLRSNWILILLKNSITITTIELSQETITVQVM